MKAVLFTALIGSIFAATVSAQPIRRTDELSIESNSKFIKDPEFGTKINAAIQLLQLRAPAELASMRSLIGKIRATEVSGANFNEEIMTIDIARLTFDASLEWLASVLIHETNHIKKFKETGKKFGDAHLLPDKKVALQIMINEELDCNRVQLAVLEKVGGKKYEIDYLRNQKGDHFDIDKDGDYDEADYKARKW